MLELQYVALTVFCYRQKACGASLGARRSGITMALGQLKKSGLIRYWHGKIEILDHAGLEAACCECYGQVHEAYNRLLS